MSDERRDDEIIGRALARAIETIDVNQTPFEKSRIATAPARRSIFGLWQLAGGVVAIVLAIAIGSWFTRPTDGQPAVAASPSAPSSTSNPATTGGPAATTASDRIWVYFARDGLAPTGGFVTGTFDDRRPESRILSRLGALRYARAGLPSGATNPFAEPTPTQSGTGTFGLSISLLQGDLATVEFELSNGWGVRGSAQSLALVQQLVYTITEEPGVRRALITEKGKPNAVIDQLVIDRPLTREDVSGYSAVKIGDSINEDGAVGARLSYATSTDKLAPGLTRFVVTAQAAESPRFSVSTSVWDDSGSTGPGKYALRVQVLGSDDKYAGVGFGLETFDTTPLRAVKTTVLVAAGTGSMVTNYDLLLDDLRPWRVFTLSNPTRVVVDIGGPPRATSESVAVYSPRAGEATGRTVTVSGAARAFEAAVSLRVKDSSDRVVSEAHTTASLGTSAVWGTFQTTIAIPSNVSGNVTLEVFWASPRDGAEMGLVQIPLVVR
jgi:immunoglobulin-like protein involved in spore germination